MADTATPQKRNTQAQDDFYLVRWADTSDASGFDMTCEAFNDYESALTHVQGFQDQHKLHSVLHIFGSVSDVVTNEFSPALSAYDHSANRADYQNDTQRDEAMA